MNFIFSWIKYGIGMFFFKIQGWKCGIVPKEIGDKYVLIGFPHNTNMDAPFGFGFSFVNRIQSSPMIKKEWMFWPMSIVFKVMKVMPIDRSSAGNMVTQVAEEFSKRDKFFPVVFPEGTRKDVKKIKTGFWHIADQAKVPIVFLYKDGQKKQLLILGHMFTGTSKEDDLIKIRDIYREAGYEIPLGDS
ncbi:MAG: 1-acyl-sn-glycerol-3-phosphate acyltransferase [Desulfobacteraceae bacterium]|jgi:1-acyl-sn-glycerol-3-phosphate acyltransferase|nr:1-acyl-sn-glycerol-3-phosphate acyltransferase [Desulfobacteraceae bacterium]